MDATDRGGDRGRRACPPGVVRRLAPALLRGLLLPFVALLILGAELRAQEEDDPYRPPIAGGWDPIESLGQPPQWKPFLRLGFGIDRTGTGEAAGPTAAFGLFRDFFNPVIGALGASAQGYLGQRGEEFDGGIQALLESRANFLHAGVDWNARSGDADPIVGITFPLRRGGWPVRGSQFRLDWIPGRDQNLVVGFTFPLRQPLQGRTRPRTVDVELPDPPGVRFLPAPDPNTRLGAAVKQMGELMHRLAGLHNFFWITDSQSLDYQETVSEIREALAGFREGLEAEEGAASYRSQVRRYHRSLERAFGVALGAGPQEAVEVGRGLAARARRVTLDEVVLPYNRTVGRYKQPDVLGGLTARARARFIAWLEVENGIPAERRVQVLGVLDAWLQEFEALRKRMEGAKTDDRMHWLPLALVLREEEHGTREQIDALLSRALDREFTTGNTVDYIDALRFQGELERTIRETEHYHVLWIHDYRGRNDEGDPDIFGARTTVAYLRALLESVRAYDEKGSLPVYLMLIDQHFYEGSDGRLWLDLLEEPLSHRVFLPPGNTEMERRFAALQDSLRTAVAESRRLQAEAEALGSEWIERVIKIHVNVTNPADFTFRSRRLLARGPPIGADNLLRDHRKIIFRDVTERDPARGEAIVAGVGVGEHYLSPTWDDRALVLRGPAALDAKEAARGVLERHGLEGRDLPAPLRPQQRSDDYADRVRALEEKGATARVLQAHNRTGWGQKDATYLQMLLYELVPPGTVLYVPDSIWTSYEWMAQLVSAALRGCRVYVVIPSRENAPVPGFAVVSTMKELATRLVLVEEAFGDLIEEAGGELRVGVYTRRAALDDTPSLLAAVDSTFARNPFLNRLFPFAPATWSVLRNEREAAGIRGEGRGPVAHDPFDVVEEPGGRRPKMHRKTQLIASGALMEALATSDRMPEIVELALGEEESRVLGEGPSEHGPRHGELPAEVGEGGNGAWSVASGFSSPAGPSPTEPSAATSFERLRETYHELIEGGELGEGERILYFLTGSSNKNVRSMALDGEVVVSVAGAWALQAYLDFVVLSGGTSWVRGVEDVEALLPEFTGLQRFFARWLYRVL